MVWLEKSNGNSQSFRFLLKNLPRRTFETMTESERDRKRYDQLLSVLRFEDVKLLLLVEHNLW